MPTKGRRWRHVVINTHGSWLHGDERGFRSRHHRIHSSGDYRNPPPAEEHEGLRRYHRELDDAEIVLAKHLRPIIGLAILNELRSQGYRVAAVAVTKVHGHIEVELPDVVSTVKRVVGQSKRKSSRAVKSDLPGSVWSTGCTYKPIDNRARLNSVHDYIIYDQGSGAWTWSYLDGCDEGKFRRVRPTR